MKSGSLKLLEPSGPVQACNGIVLPLPTTNMDVPSLEGLTPGSEPPTYLSLWRQYLADLGWFKKEQLSEDVTGLEQASQNSSVWADRRKQGDFSLDRTILKTLTK